MGCNGDTMFMAKHSAFSPYRLYRRETGFGVPIGAGDALAKSLYCGMKPIASWDYECANALPTGGVFNLEFSPEGSLLVAACEKKSIQIFDPLTHQRIHTVNGAHSDCVNCVKFLDGRMFATCSDDTTIALWDVRNLKKKIRSLLGHSNWVKNIEFSVKDKLLVTSGLDGSIYTWDINSYTECNLVYQRVFHASGLMRCRLSPDAKQMIMCTTGGLIVIIHDLNLATLAKDLHGFKPNLYRLMQMSLQVIPIASMYEHLFDANRTENRVEFISDFPERNDAEVVSALQIHPQGWCALSRNISHDDRSEWSCIHDIQPFEDEPEKSVQDTAPPELRKPLRRLVLRRRPRRPLYVYERPSTSRAPPREEPPPPDPAARQPPVGLSNDVWEASITIKQHRMLQEMYSRGQVGRNFNMQRIMGINTGISPPATHAVRHNSRIIERPPRQSASSTSSSSSSALPSPQSSSASAGASSSLEWSSSLECGSRWKEVMQPRIRQNRQRLLYYVQETNEGKGFIKELCFSADGRVVCSPFGRGVRLLTLDENCRELPQLASGVDPATINPQPLHEAGQSLGVHQDLVVSTKFSPRYHLLVTGCLEGKIVWYQPYSGESLY